MATEMRRNTASMTLLTDYSKGRAFCTLRLNCKIASLSLLFTGSVKTALTHSSYDPDCHLGMLSAGGRKPHRQVPKPQYGTSKGVSTTHFPSVENSVAQDESCPKSLKDTSDKQPQICVESALDKNLQRWFVHQEVLVRDVPGISARESEYQQVTNR